MPDVELRELVPHVLSVLVRRGADFATAEDAVQEALVRALAAWETEMPAEPTGWLITVAWRAFLDMTRSETARRDREVRYDDEPPAGAIPGADDTLHLYFLCAHPDLTPSSAVALTLRAVGGLTTRQIAQAYLVPEPTMAQRISRAKSTVNRAGVERPGDVRTVMRVLYLVFNEGYSGDVDLAAEAIRLTRQLAVLVDDAEVHGLLALMLLHHGRRRSRTRPDGSIVPLAEQDRSQWDRELIAEGIVIVQAALARDRLGEYQAQAAIAALHADASRVEETDWVQIVEWYDELLRFADTPIVRLNRAVAVGEADGAPAGLAALAEVDEHVPRHDAVAAYLHEKNGELELAARLYACAARNAPNLAEHDHQDATSSSSQPVPAAPPMTVASRELARPAGPGEAGLVGEDDELGPIARPHLDHRPADVGARRGRAHDQPLGDLVVGQPLGDQRDDLALAVGEHVEARRELRLLGSAGELLDEAAGDARRQQGVAVHDRPHGAHQLGRLGVLDEEAVGPGPDRLEDVLVEVERREDHDAGAGEALVGSDAARRREPVDARHAHVHQHDVGAGLDRLADGLVPVGGLADDGDVRLGVEEGAKTGPDQGLVVGEQRR